LQVINPATPLKESDTKMDEWYFYIMLFLLLVIITSD
jgi:hypothetical protein